MKRSDLLKIVPPEVHIPGRYEIEKDFAYTVLARTVPGELGRRVFDEFGGDTVPEDGEPMLLVLWLYDNRRDLRYSVYCSALEMDFRSYDHAKKAWREATLYNLCYFTHYRAKQFRYADAESATLGGFFRSEDPDTLRSCHAWQMTQRKRTTMERILKSHREIDALMSEVGPLPTGIERFIDNHVLSESRYIYYEKRGRVMHGYCTHCKQSFDTDKYPKGTFINKTWKCPLCGTKVTVKSFARSAVVRDEGSFQVVDRVTGGLMISWWRVGRRYERDRVEKRGYEQAAYPKRRVYLGYGGLRRVYHWDDRCTSLGHQMRWYDDSDSDRVVYRSRVFPGNLKHLLADTPWRYTALYEMARSGELFDASVWLTRARNEPVFEKCVKIGLTRLASDGMRTDLWRYPLRGAGNLPVHKALEITRSDLRELQKCNGGSEQALLVKRMRGLGRSVTAEDMRLLKRAEISCGTIAEFDYGQLLSCVSLYRMAKYASAQRKLYPIKCLFCDPIVSDWRDYLNECAKLGYDLTSNSVVMPANLHEAHTRTSKLIRQKRNAELDAKISARLEKLSALYAWQGGGYLVRMAKSTGELIAEGAKQSICVGNYADRYADGADTILFVRKTETPDEPFVTAEVVESEYGVRVVQVRAYRNSVPDEDTMKFWDAYKRKVLDKLGGVPWQAEHEADAADVEKAIAGS